MDELLQDIDQVIHQLSQAQEHMHQCREDYLAGFVKDARRAAKMAMESTHPATGLAYNIEGKLWRMRHAKRDTH